MDPHWSMWHMKTTEKSLLGDVYVVGASGPDALVRKYSSSGNVLWTRQMGGGLFADYAQAVSLSSDGTLLTAGFTYGTFLEQNYFGSTDAFLMKMDAFVPVDLFHTILLLRLFAGMATDGPIPSSGNIFSYDFNHNSTIDAGDVIFILQKVSGVRRDQLPQPVKKKNTAINQQNMLFSDEMSKMI